MTYYFQTRCCRKVTELLHTFCESKRMCTDQVSVHVQLLETSMTWHGDYFFVDVQLWLNHVCVSGQHQRSVSDVKENATVSERVEHGKWGEWWDRTKSIFLIPQTTSLSWNSYFRLWWFFFINCIFIPSTLLTCTWLELVWTNTRPLLISSVKWNRSVILGVCGWNSSCFDRLINTLDVEQTGHKQHCYCSNK